MAGYLAPSEPRSMSLHMLPGKEPICQRRKRETQVWSLGGEDSLEEEMAPHFSILAWEIPWTEETSRLQSMGLQRVGREWACACTHTHTHTHTRSGSGEAPPSSLAHFTPPIIQQRCFSWETNPVAPSRGLWLLHRLPKGHVMTSDCVLKLRSLESTGGEVTRRPFHMAK